MKITRILSFIIFILILIAISSSFTKKITLKGGDKLTKEEISKIKKEIASLKEDSAYFTNTSSRYNHAINMTGKKQKK